MINRYRFNDVFQELPNGHLVPNRVLNINGVIIGPGVSIGPGVYFGGIDFFKIKGRDLAGLEQDGVLVIRGYYGPPVAF